MYIKGGIVILVKEYINIFFMVIISMSSVLIAVNNINPYKLTIKDNIIMSISMVSMYFLLRYFFPEFATIALYFIPVFFIFQKSKKLFASILIEIFTCIIIIIIDNLVSTISYFIFGENYSTSTLKYWITCFVIITVVYIASRFIGELFRKYKIFILANLKSKYFIMIYAMLIITFGIFYFDINWSKYFNPVHTLTTNAIIGLIYGMIMIIVCISLLFMVKKEEKFKYEQMELENLKGYTDNLEKLYTEMRKFRHDYINIISSMAAFIEEKDINGLENYFNTYIHPLNNKMYSNNYKLGLLKNIQMQEVKGLISAKVIRAQEVGIDVVIDIAEVIDKIEMDKIDLIRSLGIIIDNAMEAAINSTTKNISIALIKRENSVVIVVTNTYGDEILPISKMFEAGVSTKGKKRGLGLSSLKEILGKYKNVSLDTYIHNEQFIQEITICNK